MNGTRLDFKRYLIDSRIRAVLQREALANLTQRKNMKPSLTDCLNVLSEPQDLLYYNYLKSVLLKISLNNKAFLPLCHHFFKMLATSMDEQSIIRMLGALWDYSMEAE